MGEALYPWPLFVRFCDYCDRPSIGFVDCPRCGRSMKGGEGIQVAPAFHWEDPASTSQKDRD